MGEKTNTSPQGSTVCASSPAQGPSRPWASSRVPPLPCTSSLSTRQLSPHSQLTKLTRGPKPKAGREASLAHRVLLQVRRQLLVINILEVGEMDLRFERVACNESVQGGVVLREEEAELAVVAEDLGRESLCDACVVRQFVFASSTRKAHTLDDSAIHPLAKTQTANSSQNAPLLPDRVRPNHYEQPLLLLLLDHLLLLLTLDQPPLHQLHAPLLLRPSNPP